MFTKELIEARWKIIFFLGLTAVATTGLTASFELIKVVFADLIVKGEIPEQLVGSLTAFNNFPYWVWSQWFGKAGGQILVLVAALLGAGMIAAEVSKGTIYFLLSRPLSRDRVLLAKYGTGAGLLLGILLAGAVCIVGTTAVLGQSQNLGGALLSTLQLWLGVLFVLGVALVASVVLGDTVRAEIVTVALAVVIGTPALVPVPGWADWSLAYYWSSFDTFSGAAFPLKALAINLLAAVVPLFVAVGLFRRQVY